MAARLLRFAVSATPNMLGRIYPAEEFFDAIMAAKNAAAAGWEGKLYAIMDDGTVRPFDTAAKAFTAAVPWPF